MVAGKVFSENGIFQNIFCVHLRALVKFLQLISMLMVEWHTVFNFIFVVLCPGVFRVSAVSDELCFIRWFSHWSSHHSDLSLCLSRCKAFITPCSVVFGAWVGGNLSFWQSFPAPSPEGVVAVSSVSIKPGAGTALLGSQGQTWLLGSRPGCSGLRHSAPPVLVS